MSDAPTSLPLVFAAPRRSKPPRHLADLDAAARRTVVEDLGEPGFRARQLARHYFVGLVDDPAGMTDLPAGSREQLAAALLPPLVTAVRTRWPTWHRPARPCGACTTAPWSSRC
jgi:23S rRNA (adenine2503-C2)-methyltransferase